MGLFSRLWTFVSDGPLALPSSDYFHFHNIVIPTTRGTTEVDHLIVSRFGIFVIELKDYSGWIFGDPHDSHWTSANYSGKYRFQNPLHQNYGHLKALEHFLDLDARFFRGIVVFRGSFEFKTPIPDGVLCHRYRSRVASHREIILSDTLVDRSVRALETHASRGWIAGRKHARAVRERWDSDTTCPKCGAKLRIRTQKRAANPGSQFLGCSNYPKCKFTKRL